MSKWYELKRLAEECPWDQIEGFEYDAAGGKAYCLGSGAYDHLVTTFDRRFQKYLEGANPRSILALIEENEALRKDAERYRWLRANAYGSFMDGALEDLFSYNDDIIDERIDAAIRKEPLNG